MNRNLAFLAVTCALWMIWGTPDVARSAAAYVGAGGGAGGATVDQGTVNFDTGDWTPSISAWRVFAGYEAVRHLGLEAGYLSLGKPRVSTMGGDYFEARLSGFDVTPVGSVPLVKSLSAFARVGVVFWQSEMSYLYSALGTGTTKKSGTGLALGLGLEYGITRNVLLRGEGALYGIDKGKAGAGDSKVATLSGRFAF